MREIYLLENLEACTQFILTRANQGFSPETFLGVGFFSSQLSGSGRGLRICSSPSFFEHELAENMVQGYFSPFEKESLLMQVNLEQIDGLPISRWLLIGQHFSLFSLEKSVDVIRHLPTQELLSISHPEEFIQVYLRNLFPHIQEIRAQSLLFLFDTQIFCGYIAAFFKWLFAQKKYSSHFKKCPVPDLSLSHIQKKVTEEFLWYLADTALHPCAAIFPSTQNCFEDFMMSARNVCRYGNLTEELMFRL
jgi:hypothetical protein